MIDDANDFLIFKLTSNLYHNYQVEKYRKHNQIVNTKFMKVLFNSDYKLFNLYIIPVNNSNINFRYETE